MLDRQRGSEGPEGLRLAQVVMQKLTIVRRPESTRRPKPFYEKVRDQLKRSVTADNGRGLSASILGVAFIGMLSWVQQKTNLGFNFEFFYLFACALVGWFAGVTSGVTMAALSSICLYLVEKDAASTSLNWLFVSNTTIRALALGGISWLAAYAGRVTRELRGSVEQRTARLEQEVQHHKETAETLDEALQVFQQLTDNIKDVFWVTDAEKSHMEYVSPAFEEIWGQSCQTLCLSPGVWLEGIHYQDRERVTKAVYAKQIAGKYDEEYRVVRPDGSVRWVHERAFPVRNEAGAIYRLVGIAEDITERKRTEHLLQAERDVGMALSSTSDMNFALNRLLDVAMQLEGIDCGGVYLVEPETGELHLQAHRGLSGSFLQRISHYHADATEAMLARSGHSLYIRQEQIPRSLEVLWGSEGLKALAVVPVQHHGNVLGVLNLGSYRQEEIFPRTRLGIEMIASQVAGAIARIRAEDSLRQSEAHLRTIINSAPIALLATDAAGRITLEDGQGLAAMGIKPNEHARRLATEVYQDHPLMFANVGRAQAGEEFSSVLEFDSMTFDCRFTPLRDKQHKPAGFIAVATDVTERFRLQREILEISEREQARIGQDVHDGLCQQLIGAALKANSLTQSVEPGQAADTARKLCTLLDEAITESRRVCRGLYPIRLRREGLLPALEELASTSSERHQVQCTCEHDTAALACDVATATHLYRIAQEAINNAVKHSGARHIAIRVAGAGNEIRLEIRDDGKGLSRTAKSGPGMGLHIMDYRARLIGGNLELQTGSEGTMVACCVPQASVRAGL